MSSFVCSLFLSPAAVDGRQDQKQAVKEQEDLVLRLPRVRENAVAEQPDNVRAMAQHGPRFDLPHGFLPDVAAAAAATAFYDKSRISAALQRLSREDSAIGALVDGFIQAEDVAVDPYVCGASA